jgi:DNA-binding NarL/FixJ family response regulator
MLFQMIYLAVFLLVGVLLSFDIRDDLSKGSDVSHVVTEVSAASLCFLAFAAILFYQYRCWTSNNTALKIALRDMSEEKNEWQRRARESLISLSQVIDEQFTKWSLTEAEKEVGLLMLKGLSHKEIANIRNSSEKTVRQQAGALYSKSGLDGKSQLSAFFLEDLMIPSKSKF